MIEAFVSSGSVVYAVLRNASGQIWSVSGSAWVTINLSNWANYVIALSDDGSGYYTASMPAVAAGRYTILLYQQNGGSPDPTNDDHIGNSNGNWTGSAWEAGWSTASRSLTGGVDVTSVNGSSTAAARLAISAASMVSGAAASGTLSVSQMTTNLAATLANVYVGRVIYFTTGNLTGRVAAISAYAVSGGKLSFFTPLPQAPVAGDQFIIV